MSARHPAKSISVTIAVTGSLGIAGWTVREWRIPPSGERELAAIEEAYRDHGLEIPNLKDVTRLVDAFSKALLNRERQRPGNENHVERMQVGSQRIPPVRSLDLLDGIKITSQLGQELLNEKRYEEAVGVFNLLIEIDSEFGEAISVHSDGAHTSYAAMAYAGRGTARLLLKELQEACQDVRKACDLNYCEGLKAFQSRGLCSN